MFKVMRSGESPKPQLNNFPEDPAETKNLASKNSAKLKELTAMLNQIVAGKSPSTTRMTPNMP